MTMDHYARGGAAVAVLNRMEAWEANLVLNLRLWCEGPKGQAAVWNEFRRSFEGPQASAACRAFEVLINTLADHAHRPLVRHDVGCSCVGADESVFVNLVRTASEGHLNDAALIATLIAGPAKAEHIAILAGDVGASMRHFAEKGGEVQPVSPTNVVRLH